MDDEEIIISEIELDGKKYLKKLITKEDVISYNYYCLENGIEKKLEDEKILKQLKELYECNEGNIVY